MFPEFIQSKDMCQFLLCDLHCYMLIDNNLANFTVSELIVAIDESTNESIDTFP